MLKTDKSHTSCVGMVKVWPGLYSWGQYVYSYCV